MTLRSAILKTATTLLLVAGLANTAFGSTPTVHEVQYQIEQQVQKLRKQGATKPTATTDRWRWTVALLEAQLKLVSGNRAQFQDEILRLDEMPFPNMIGSYVKMAELYSNMVELDIPVPIDKFDEYLRVVKSEIRRIEGTEAAPKPSFDDAKWLRIRGNCAYAKMDLPALSELKDQSRSLDSDHLTGYLEYLAFKLDHSPEQEQKAIGALEPIILDAQERGDETQGLIALYLAELYLARASRDYSNEDVGKAIEYSRYARRNIEILDSPAAWALAMALSVEVFDKQKVLEASGSKGARILDLRSLRASDLAVEYM